MSEPLAYHITWTTYGTWLPGDARGWVEAGKAEVRPGDPKREAASRNAMSDPPVTLDERQRAIVQETIRAHCGVRGWQLHAINARTNHVHVVVTAVGTDPDTVMNQFKAWCSRRLNEQGARKSGRWWTKNGSTTWINDEGYFRSAVAYVLEGQ
jgi:REP element-mobilizing transposase RayT